MSPTQNHDHQHAMRETNNLIMPPSPLKINKDSHFIKKSSPPRSSSPSLTLSSSSSSSTLVNGIALTASAPAPTPSPPPARTPPRRPVIIYTHSPKVIHTNPKDFMALVQKLTGLSRPEDDDDHAQDPPKPKIEPGIVEKDGNPVNNNNNKSGCIINNNNNNNHDDNECTSVMTDENGGSVGDGVQVNSFYIPHNFDPPNPYFNSVPFYNSNANDFICSGSAQQFNNNNNNYNYSDSLLLMPNMRSSLSSSTLESMKEISDQF